MRGVVLVARLVTAEVITSTLSPWMVSLSARSVMNLLKQKGKTMKNEADLPWKGQSKYGRRRFNLTRAQGSRHLEPIESYCSHRSDESGLSVNILTVFGANPLQINT